MKKINLFNCFKVDDAIQQGMNEFHRQSGYKMIPPEKTESFKNTSSNKTKTFLKSIFVFTTIPFLITQIIKLKK